MADEIFKSKTTQYIGFLLFIIGGILLLFVGGSLISIFHAINDLLFNSQLATGIPTWVGVLAIILFIIALRTNYYKKDYY